MSTIIGGSSPSVTFPDSTVQDTSAIVGGKVPYANLPSGSVLQVVNSTYGTGVSSSSTTYIDTGLTATITPKFSTSKILIIAVINDIEKGTNNTYGSFKVLCNGNQVITFAGEASYTANSASNATSASCTYLDSQGTTSALTYKVQFMSQANVAYVKVQANNNNSSLITLMEIAG